MKKLYSDKDLEKLKKQNSHHRRETLKNHILNAECLIVKLVPWIFLVLFVLNLIQPAWIKNLTLLDRAVYALATGILVTLATKIQNDKVD